MKYRILVVASALAAIAMSANAGEKRDMEISIATIDDATQEEVRVELDSKTLGFDLHDMQVGENRAVVDKNGQNVLITREADGFKFDVDGKTIDMPLHHGGPGGHHKAFAHGPDGDKEIRIMRMHGGPMPPGGPGGVVIMSGEPIDEATQQSIKALLESAGHDSEVHFIEHSMTKHDDGENVVIEKRVEVRK